MRNWIRNLRPTYSGVAATLALVLALGGGTAVALKGKNSVDSGDIKNHQVKATDLAQPKVVKVKENPYTPAAADPCDSGKTGIFCGTANQFGSRRGWFNFGNGYGSVGYWIDAYGQTHMTGELGAGFPLTSVGFILPKAFRPKHTVEELVAHAVGPGCGGQCGDDLGKIQITTDGRVTVVDDDRSGDDGYSLDGIVFSAG